VTNNSKIPKAQGKNAKHEQNNIENFVCFAQNRSKNLCPFSIHIFTNKKEYAILYRVSKMSDVRHFTHFQIEKETKLPVGRHL